jgi:hypothetical protein
VRRAPVLNLGAGTQSSVLLLMACSGELEERGFETPEVAVFADTQDEPNDVMEWLPYLRVEAHKAGIRLVEGTAGSLRDDVLAERGLEAPKSACVMCPMRSDAGWRQMKVERPDEFAQAVDFDLRVRTGLPGLNGDAFVHSSLQPLGEVDFSNAEDRGQLSLCEVGGCWT